MKVPVRFVLALFEDVNRSGDRSISEIPAKGA